MAGSRSSRFGLCSVGLRYLYDSEEGEQPLHCIDNCCVEDSIEWQAIDIIWKNTASIPPPDSHIRWAPPKSGDHFCSSVIRINRTRQSRVGSSQPGTFLALESGFINQRRARVQGVRASWAVLQAMLQGILKAAGPVGYYSKVLKGVLFLDHRSWMLCLFLARRFVHGSSFFECFIPGLL